MQVQLSQFTQPLATFSGFTAGFSLFRLSLTCGGLPVVALAYPVASGVGLAANRVALMGQQPLPTRKTAAKVVLVGAIAGLLVSTAVSGVIAGTLLLSGSTLIGAVANGVILGNLIGLNVSAAVGAFPSLYGRVQRLYA